MGRNHGCGFLELLHLWSLVSSFMCESTCKPVFRLAKPRMIDGMCHGHTLLPNHLIHRSKPGIRGGQPQQQRWLPLVHSCNHLQCCRCAGKVAQVSIAGCDLQPWPRICCISRGCTCAKRSDCFVQQLQLPGCQPAMSCGSIFSHSMISETEQSTLPDCQSLTHMTV